LEDGVEVKANITSEEYTFFEVIGDVDSYTLLSFELCHEESSSNTE
jgi:hypothetical protein